jgi:hypothetical protein
MGVNTTQEDDVQEQEGREYVEGPVEVELREDKEAVVSDEATEDSVEEEELSERDRIAKEYQEREYGSEEETAPEEEAEEETVPEEELSEEIEVKVNGKTRMVLREKVESAGGLDVYQKRLAAEEGMQQVTNERRQVQAERQQLRDDQQKFHQWQQKQLQKDKSPPQGGTEEKESPPEGGSDVKVMAQKYREALYDGNDDKADEIFAQMAKAQGAQPATPNVNPDEIANQVLERTRKKMQEDQRTKDVRAGQKLFSEKFNDIAQDPRLFEMTNSETVRVQNENPDWSPQEVIEEAGSRIRSWAEDHHMIRRNDKLDKKRAINTPRAASGRANSKPAPQPMSNRDYVKNQQKLRTGASL